MIQARQATEYIETELKKLVQNGELKGKLEKSNTSISIYLRTKDPSNPPKKYFRSSNHHPTHSTLLKNQWKPWNTINISVEFAETRRNEEGNVIKNKWNDRINQNVKGTIKPFLITVYEYIAANLEEEDIPKISDAVIEFTKTGIYNDPFKDTPKAARPIPRPAKIIPRKVQPEPNSNPSQSVPQQNHLGDSKIPRYNIIKEYNNQNNCNRNMRNKKVVRLTESQLHSIIAESVSDILNEFDWKSAGSAYLDAMENNAPQISLNPIKNINNIMRSLTSPGVIKFWKTLFGLNGGESIENYIKGATENLQKLQQSGVLKTDQNLNTSVQNCLKALQNFGKQAQEIKIQIQQNSQPQSQGQSQLQTQQESINRFKRKI